MPKSNSGGCYSNSSSLHKQTRRTPLCRDVCSSVENHDLVPSLPDNSKSQAHTRVPECDSRHAFPVKPSPINRMITVSAGVQADLSKVVHSLFRYICHLSEPQSSIVCISDQHAWDIDAVNINWSGLTASAYPPPPPLPRALLHRVIQNIRQCICLIIVIAPGWPGLRWFGDLVQLSTDIPLQLPVLTTLFKQSMKVAERISAPQRLSTRTIYKSKWALFEKWCIENLVDFSTPSVKQVSDFFMYLYQDLNKRIVGFRWTKSCKLVTGKLTTHLQFFYLKDLTGSSNDNNMYLGPVVVAQQVPNPSPQTSHPQK